MKIAQINATCGVGSTGKICSSVAALLSSQHVDNVVLYSQNTTQDPHGILYGKPLEIKADALKARLFGNYGFQSKVATKRLIAELERYSPDVVHVHNIHSHNADLDKLFSWFRAHHTKIVWTFHDCWAFTGYCMHYDMIGCDKWKTQCDRCPQKTCYSWTADRSRWIFEKKRELFSDLDLTIVTPSQWLADQVKQSFLQEYPTHVIQNGIDLAVFRPQSSDIRQRLDCADKRLVLGVAFGWDRRKGLDVFLELAKRLDDRYQIVLVGVDEKVEKQLPSNIRTIRRTQDQQELAQLYTAADVLVNPTREDTYPTVNMEALACGTPVVTFRTGGSPEMLNEACGVVVEKNDVDGIEQAIHRVCEQSADMREACLAKAAEFDQNRCFEKYTALYQEVLHERASKG